MAGSTPQIPTGTYNFADVVVIINGQTQLGGVTVKVSRSSAGATKAVGANGDVVFSANQDESGEIEIEYMPSSPSIDDLSQLALAFQSDLTLIAVSVNDLSGRSIASGADCVVEKIADKSYAAASENVTFKMLVGHLATIPGGSV